MQVTRRIGFAQAFLDAVSKYTVYLAAKTVGCEACATAIHPLERVQNLWRYRPDGSNPCRHVPKYPENGETRYIVNDELARLYAYLDRADAEGLEHPTLTLAIRLQFEFSARMSEIRLLEWPWIDFENRRIVWPDSKTGDISKPMSEVAYQLLSNACRVDDSPYVCPAIFDSSIPLPESTYYNGRKRILKRANGVHVGMHGIRHRTATDIANSGIPVKVGMALTAHKTVSMFMRYVHAEDDPIRAAAEKVTNLRRDTIDSRAPMVPAASPTANPADTNSNKTFTSRGSYRPYRHCKESCRAVPPGSKRAVISEEEAA